jgi:hypothetical protein
LQHLWIEEAFDATRLSDLLLISKTAFSITLVELISSFFSNKKFQDSAEGEMSTPSEIQACVPK